MGESLSPDRVFDFLGDELEPHPAYDFFAPGPLPLYAGNPNNNNGWLEVDDYLLREIEAMVDEPMAVPAIEEVAEPVAKVEGGGLGGPSTMAAEGPSFLLPAPGLPIHPSVIEDLSTRLGNLEYGHVMASQMVHAADRWEQIGAQVKQGQQTAAQRDESIAELTQQV
nr:hypothetical protein [Tanacetum cinerariifolium]